MTIESTLCEDSIVYIMRLSERFSLAGLLLCYCSHTGQTAFFGVCAHREACYWAQPGRGVNSNFVIPKSRKFYSFRIDTIPKMGYTV